MRERGAIVMVFTPRAENLRRRVAGRGVSVVCEERSGPDENGLASINSERMWMAGRRGASLPPVALFRVGERNFVADGHHRLSVAHALGMAAIDAEVTELGQRASRHPA